MNTTVRRFLYILYFFYFGILLTGRGSQSWTMLQGQSTLLDVKNAFDAMRVYAPEGSSVQSGDQFMITEDSIQVVDLIVVRSFPLSFL
jgi:hypothetical protein